jgi:hypothetical protein
MAWAEVACRAVEKATRSMFRFGLKVGWGPGQARHDVDVAWINERERVLACDSSLHALLPPTLHLPTNFGYQQGKLSQCLVQY